VSHATAAQAQARPDSADTEAFRATEHRVVPIRRHHGLSSRERFVLERLAEGASYPEIARNISDLEREFVSQETVKSVEYRLLSKLRARSGAHAVAIAIRSRIIA
jgi:DNA-binding CsgD family transcriptional regulator